MTYALSEALRCVIDTPMPEAQSLASSFWSDLKVVTPGYVINSQQDLMLFCFPTIEFPCGLINYLRPLPFLAFAPAGLEGIWGLAGAPAGGVGRLLWSRDSSTRPAPWLPRTTSCSHMAKSFFVMSPHPTPVTWGNAPHVHHALAEQQ